jgi:hypothetical protein
MIGSFGRKRHGGGLGKKAKSSFKKGVVAGGLLLAGGLGIYGAIHSDENKESSHSYDHIAKDPTESGVQGHNPALVAKAETVGKPLLQASAPPPAIDLESFEKAGQLGGKKQKVGAGLKLAGEVVSGDTGKVKALKEAYDIVKADGSTDSIEAQIARAEKKSKGSSLSQIGSALGITKGNKISRESVGVGDVPMIGPVAPPEFFEDQPKKKGKLKKVFSNPLKKK